jgi:ABC-type multidrug transport system fused ATPase/permease subunit
MSRFAVLKQIMLQHRYRLVITYILFSIEMLGSLLRPFFLGLAVNDLIKGSYDGLILLSVVHFCWLITGIIRHRLDTRTYSAIYTSLVTKFLTRRYNKSDVSKLSAHSTLAKEFVDFLEFDLAYVVEAFYSIIGSLILLFFYDTSVVLVCLSILLPVIGFSYFYGKRMRILNRQKNDELEKQVDIISTGNNHLISQHYNNLRKWQIRISDQEAWNFGIMEIMVIVVIGLSLLITNKTAGSGIEAGSLIGIYSYIQRFVSGLDTIPYTVQRLSSLNDITRRVELQQEDLEKPDPINIGRKVVA